MKYMNWEDLEPGDILKLTPQMKERMVRYNEDRKLPEYFKVKCIAQEKTYGNNEWFRLDFGNYPDYFHIKFNGDCYAEDFQAFEIVKVVE